MIAEVGRIIGPNSHAINANRENSSVSSTVNALLKTRGELAFSVYSWAGEQMLLSSLPQIPVFLPWGGDLKWTECREESALSGEWLGLGRGARWHPSGWTINTGKAALPQLDTPPSPWQGGRCKVTPAFLMIHFNYKMKWPIETEGELALMRAFTEP